MLTPFPKDFIFGAATSSFQIEGNHLADGATPSNWYHFCQNKLGISGNELNKLGCNHYHYWKEDVALIKELGLSSYRFSVSWPRIIPSGYGSHNSKGLDFYDNLVDELLNHDISPMLTLFHWDYPQVLEDQGGWANPDSPEWFVEYVQAVAERLGDRIPIWITMNEPWVFLHLGFIKGIHAPGYSDLEHAAAAYSNILKAHSKSVEYLRSHHSNSEVGLSCNISPFVPASESEADANACRRIHDYHNKLFLDPCLKGSVPEVVEKAFDKYIPEWLYANTEQIKHSLDFIGVNYYTFFRIKQDKNAFLQATSTPPAPPLTDMKWEVYPKGLYDAIEWTYNRYETPLYITENGCAYTEQPHNGKVEDERRSDFMYRHLKECRHAISNGIPLKGYYAWSLLDNFEWTFGLNKRFGLIHVDFESYQRTIKNSGYFYRDFINGKTDKPDHIDSGTNNVTEGQVWHDDIDFRAV